MQRWPKSILSRKGFTPQTFYEWPRRNRNMIGFVIDRPNGERIKDSGRNQNLKQK
jgi:hypothetical protein